MGPWYIDVSLQHHEEFMHKHIMMESSHTHMCTHILQRYIFRLPRARAGHTAELCGYKIDALTDGAGTVPRTKDQPAEILKTRKRKMAYSINCRS